MKKVTPIVRCNKYLHQNRSKLDRIVLFSCLVLISACKNTILPIEDNLIIARTWEIQSYSVFKNNYSNSELIRHYKNIGKFIFEEDGTGQLIDANDTISISWFLNDWSDGTGNITFNISKEEIEDFTNPFIFYYFKGVNPFFIDEAYLIDIYEISCLNDFTYVLSWDVGYTSSGMEFENIEFVITKLEE